MTLTLAVVVEYDPNGTNPDELKKNLHAAAEYMAGIGKFTQGTEAEVVQWDSQVVEGCAVPMQRQFKPMRP